jgi:hypothetical protein
MCYFDEVIDDAPKHRLTGLMPFFTLHFSFSILSSISAILSVISFIAFFPFSADAFFGFPHTPP